MSDIVKLGTVGGQTVPDPKARMLEAFEADVNKMREWLQQSGKGGFALIAYDRDYKGGSPQVHSWVNYFCHDPADAFWLPDMCKTRVYQRAQSE